MKRVVDSQRTYYDLRAQDYCDPSKPADRKVRSYMDPEVSRRLVDDFAPTGDVLELACGPGQSTVDLVRHARTLTVVDGSERMLERNREQIADPSVRYVCADIFEWEPDRLYDEVFFAFWLSHVPPNAFDAFWAMVRRCLNAGGRVGFVDEDDRASGHDDVRDVKGIPTATRTLSDGRTFDIVKVFWPAAELEQRLRALQWDVTVRRVGETCLYGAGLPLTNATISSMEGS